MEFKFAVNDIFKEPIVQINQNLIPPGFTGDRRTFWDVVGKVSEVVNAMGEASAAAQGLSKPITTAERLRNSEHSIYFLIDRNAGNGRGAVIGMLKVGKKGLYVFDRNGQHYQVSPPCVLDFYVHESRQRTGLGKQLYEHMLKNESIEPVKMAIDRPSEKFLGFLNKHYSLNDPVKQMNNYVVFEGFFPSSPEKNGTVEIDHSGGTPGKKQSANGLQTSSFASPLGRYGAPRPPCSMGQIIHNQTSTIAKNAEPTGVKSAPATNYQNATPNSLGNPIVTQSTPNMYYRSPEQQQNPQISQPEQQYQMVQPQYQMNNENDLNNLKYYQQQQSNMWQNYEGNNSINVDSNNTNSNRIVTNYETHYNNQQNMYQNNRQRQGANNPIQQPSRVDNVTQQPQQQGYMYSNIPQSGNTGMENSNMVQNGQYDNQITPNMSQSYPQQTVTSQNIPLQTQAQSQPMVQNNTSLFLPNASGDQKLPMSQIPQHIQSQQQMVPPSPSNIQYSQSMPSFQQNMQGTPMTYNINPQTQYYGENNTPSVSHVNPSSVQNMPMMNENQMIQYQQNQNLIGQQQINQDQLGQYQHNQNQVAQQQDTMQMMNVNQTLQHQHNQNQVIQQQNMANQNQMFEHQQNQMAQQQNQMAQQQNVAKMNEQQMIQHQQNDNQMVPQYSNQMVMNQPQIVPQQMTNQPDMNRVLQYNTQMASNVTREAMSQPNVINQTPSQPHNTKNMGMNYQYQTQPNQLQNKNVAKQTMSQPVVNERNGLSQSNNEQQNAPVCTRQTFSQPNVQNNANLMSHNRRSADLKHIEQNQMNVTDVKQDITNAQGDVGVQQNEDYMFKYGYPPQVPDSDTQVMEEKVSSSPKLERPRSLSIQLSEEQTEDKKIDDVESEVPPEETIIEEEVVEKSTLSENNAVIDEQKDEISTPDQKTPGKKTPSHLTEQGFFDLKFYHSKLW